MLFTEHFFSDILPHLHDNNDNTHKLFFTSPQNSTISLIVLKGLQLCWGCFLVKHIVFGPGLKVGIWLV